jgi:hypothetical protein
LGWLLITLLLLAVAVVDHGVQAAAVLVDTKHLLVELH